MPHDRRQFLGLAAAAPLAVLIAGRAGAQQPALCQDPASLPMSQKSFRKSLQYTETSADPVKRCDHCAFFTAAAAGCGSCQILSSTVNANAVCASFAPKAT